MIRLLAAGMIALTGVGCATISTHTGVAEVVIYEDDLRNRAAFDMDCPAKDLSVARLDSAGRNVGITGCGKKAAYTRANSAWVANTDVAADQ